MGKNEKMPVAFARLTAVVTGGKGYGISHSWEGSVLTVSSDSGSSSADLMGPRGPAGAEMFVVELRPEDGAYVADKTFAELKEHIDAGELVVCDFIGADSRTRCRLTTYAEYGAAFVMQSVLGADEYFVFTHDGVTHMTAETEDEEVLDQVSVVKTDSTVTVTAVYGFTERVTTIALNNSGDPVSVTRDGVTTTLTWEGFDE